MASMNEIFISINYYHVISTPDMKLFLFYNIINFILIAEDAHLKIGIVMLLLKVIHQFILKLFYQFSIIYKWRSLCPNIDFFI